MWYTCLRVKSGCLNAILAAYLDPKSAFINWTSSALRVQRRWLQFSDEEWDKELESIRTLNDAELVQFMKADFGSRYAARMALRHPLFTLRQVYHMVKKI